MLDTNGTRFHLLQGIDDWSRCRTVGGAQVFSESAEQIAWNDARHEITLWLKVFRFRGARSEREVSIDQRRGAACDAFGNWYWIAPDRHSILVFSAGSQTTSTFWPLPNETAEDSSDGSFRAAESTPGEPLELQGLTITEDHYLVVGSVAPGGVLVFDLYSGGAPRQRIWPIDFAPYDMATRSGGGAWILDRDHKQVWQLDRRFNVVAPAAASPLVPEAGAFASTDPQDESDQVARMPVRAEHAWSISAAHDPIAIAALETDGVLVLDRDDGSRFAAVHWLRDGVEPGPAVSTANMSKHVEVEAGEQPFQLVAHDFTFADRAADDPETWQGRLYVVALDGNQAFAFGISTAKGKLELEPLSDYFPMRLFGGRALVTSDGEPWYDCGDRFVQLVEQHRPRYAERGEVWSPVLDSSEPDCVWHRLMLDACIPPGAEVEVYTRAADDWRELTLLEWLSESEKKALGAPEEAEVGDALSAGDLKDWQREPDPYLRGDGSELPYMPRESGTGRGTWELLFQRARGRYLQIRLVLAGDGRSTPRIRALRAWYPRFSYLEHYLPAVYREDAQSASFLDRFLANMEGVFTVIEDRVAAAQLLFDVASAPPETLDWLARWFGVAIDPGWDETRRRLFIKHAMDFFAVRGTPRGLQLALRLALDDCIDERIFENPDRNARRAAPIRIIERFRARRTPRALLGDVETAVPGPQLYDPTARWQPQAGAGELHDRYRSALSLAGGSEFPLVEPSGATADQWHAFADKTLGFVPYAGAAERVQWQTQLAITYGTVSALNSAHGSAWQYFSDVPLPTDEPSGKKADDWQAFSIATRYRERMLWQHFLARRYRNIGALNAAWRTHWPAFSRVPLSDRLPVQSAALLDWFQFEGTVLMMHAMAHRFTVMLPIPKQLRSDTPAQQRRLALAKAVLELEKPAHTVFDTRFYWAMFRLGQARLGDDTLIDYGSRSPELMRPMVLGEGYLAEAFLAARRGEDAPDRLQIGRDRIGRSTRIGGP